MVVTVNNAPPEARSVRRWFGLGAISLASIGIGLVLFVLVIALPTLAVKLNATTGDLQWIIGAFQLTLAALMIPAGFLGDRYGRKRFLLGGTVLFGAASVAATQVTSPAQLIWLMAAMGTASAVIIPLSLSIVPALFPEEADRRTAVGIWAGVNFLSLPLGPLVGGWLLNNFNWTSIFWMNVPFAALAVVGVALFIPESRDPSARRLDLPGTLLAVAGVMSGVYAIIRGPIDGWSDGKVLAGIAAGVILLAALLVWERRASVPLIDLALFTKPGFAWGTLALCVAFGGMVGGLFVLTPYLQVVQGVDVMGTGVRLMPLVVTLVLVAATSNKLIGRLGRKTLMVGGLFVTGGGMLMLSQATTSSGYGLVGAALAIIGAGLGAVLAPSFDAILASLPEDQRGVGSALANALGKLSQAIGVVILGSILNSVYRGSLPALPKGLPTAAVTAVQGSVAAAVKVAGRIPGEPGRLLAAAARSAYVSGMSEVLVIAGVTALVTAILLLVFLPSHLVVGTAEPVDGLEPEAKAVTA
jgi:MFS transporter, DHA2 family, multidrug resistance protein